jgi:hypothetical protein
VAFRVIHLLDPDAGNYPWPYRVGEKVWSTVHKIPVFIADGWFETDPLSTQDSQTLGAKVPSHIQIFYKVQALDGREFSEPAEDLEPL